MTKKEAKIKALTVMWGWATNLCEGIEKNILGDYLEAMVHDGIYTEVEAKKIQKEFYEESKIIIKRLIRLKYNTQIK